MRDERFTEAEVSALADGLRGAASTDEIPQGAPAQVWQKVTRHALDRAGIEITPAQFERAWRVAWRRAFMGGSYTLDARAILRAVHGSSDM